MMHMLLINDNNDYFNKIREELNNLDILNNNLLPIELYENIKLLFEATNYKEYKNKYFKLKISQIKREYDLLTEKNNSLIDENTKLNSKLKIKRINKCSFKFKSWKITSVLRKIKNNIKDGIVNITVIGAGYVGIVTCACFSKMGNKVYCVDIDNQKLITLKIT